MSASPTDALEALIKQVRKDYTPSAEPSERSATEEFVYSFLLWDAAASRADSAFKRLMSSAVDMNDLRVTSVEELAAQLGKTYPRVEERVHRLKSALNEVYRREHEVSLDPCANLSKRDARKYLDTLEGIPQFVAARMVLCAMGGHAIPVDDRLNAKLIAAGLVEEGSSCEQTAALLERVVKAADALETHDLLQQWSEDSAAEAPVPAKRARSGAKKTGKKKTAKKKTTRKKAAARKRG